MTATARRIDNAKAQLERLKRSALDAELQAVKYGPNCRNCRYASYPGDPRTCHHPVNQSVSIDWTGKMIVSGDRRAKDMRSESGGCGPEAALFDARRLYRRVPWLIVLGVLWAAGFAGLALSIPYAEPLLLIAACGAGGPLLEFVWGRYA